MIINKPEPKDFEIQSIQYLVQSIDLIKSNDQKREELVEIEELDFNKDEYWKYHQGVLNNSLTLLFLSLENYLKKEICSVSPLMLLADEPKKWGARNSKKKFNDLFILQFDDLLVLYHELGLGNVSNQASSKLEELRKKRNKITHGVLDENITPEYVIGILYIIMMHVWGPKTWWEQVKSHIFNEPLFGAYDSDYERSSVTFYVDFFVSYLGKKKTGEMLGVNLKQRNYYCPSCHFHLNHDFTAGDSKYAILIPNTSLSTNLYCVVCDENHEVKRKKCTEPSCKGNVISEENICLTCFFEQ